MTARSPSRIHPARVAAVVAATLCAALVAAHAHDRTTSYSTWDVQGRTATVSLRLTLLDASRFPWFSTSDAEPKLQQYITQHLVLIAGTTPCAVGSVPRRLESAPERLVYEWHLTCAAPGALTIRSDLLLDVAPAHLHFSRVAFAGMALGEHVFSDAQRVWALPAGAEAGNHAAGTSFIEYVTLGIEHILTGYDHLAFLLVLLLIERTMFDVAKVVTGFAIGHSITLALASLGFVHPARSAIEAVIGLSIALVAAEDLWLMARQPAAIPWVLSAILAVLAVAANEDHGVVPVLTLSGLALFAFCYFHLSRRVRQPLRLRWAVALLFGLVHGFAFASILIEAGLPADRLAHALLAFNLGVEVGQLAIVAAVWPLALIAVRRLPAHTRALGLELTSAVVLALGVFWFASRAYG